MPLQLWAHSTRPRKRHRRTASWYVVYSNDAEFPTPTMQSSFESEDPPLAVALRRQVLPSQHCTAIGLLSIGSVVAVGSATHAPEPSFWSPCSAHAPVGGKRIGGNGGGGNGGGGGGAADAKRR